jgi:hypothetical protein
MTKIEAFCKANPADKRVVQIMKLLDQPLDRSPSLRSWGRLGKLIGTLMREEGL